MLRLHTDILGFPDTDILGFPDTEIPGFDREGCDSAEEDEAAVRRVGAIAKDHTSADACVGSGLGFVM